MLFDWSAGIPACCEPKAKMLSRGFLSRMVVYELTKPWFWKPYEDEPKQVKNEVPFEAIESKKKNCERSNH